MQKESPLSKDLPFKELLKMAVAFDQIKERNLMTVHRSKDDLPEENPSNRMMQWLHLL